MNVISFQFSDDNYYPGSILVDGRSLYEIMGAPDTIPFRKSGPEVAFFEIEGDGIYPNVIVGIPNLKKPTTTLKATVEINSNSVVWREFDDNSWCSWSYKGVKFNFNRAQYDAEIGGLRRHLQSSVFYEP